VGNAKPGERRPDPPWFGSVEWFVERRHAWIAGVIRRRLGRQYDRHRDATPEALRLWTLNDPEIYAEFTQEGL
jgi:hypothetical protein